MTQVDDLGRAHHRDLDLRVAREEAVETRQQPELGEGRYHRDLQLARDLAGDGAAYRPAEMLEAARQFRQHGAAGVGQQQPACQSLEQLDAQLLLERLHLMADGSRGDVQLVGRLDEAQVACGRLERPQAPQRWQSNRHGVQLRPNRVGSVTAPRLSRTRAQGEKASFVT